jgi:ABC-type lipoprotein release transport system permease subunit
VAAAAERDEAHGVDAFDLGEPVTLVAFGEGKATVFAGRRLLAGRRARGPGEAEVGRGLADSLGLAPGSELVVELQDGGEVRARVAGVVQELASDGRVAYLDATALAGAAGVTRQVAVRVARGARPVDVQRRLQAEGLRVAVNGGIAPSGGSLLDAVVALLRIVAVIDSLVCVALVLLALVVLARERRGAIAVLRSAGARPAQVVGLLAGAAAAHLALALPLAYLLERAVLAPALSSLVERYGDLPLAPAPGDVALVALGAALAAASTAWLAARQLLREPVAAGLGG